jgi:protein gp37
MSATSPIQWTDATWNPTTGCTKVSPGCAHCYIERTPPFRMAGNRFVHGKTDLEIFHDRLEQPLHWRKPRRVFVNSLSDLFHEGIGDAFIDRVFAVMALTPQHTYQVLTKRADRMRAYMSHRPVGELKDRIDNAACVFGACHANIDDESHRWPLPNVWLGVSVENKRMRDLRVPHLLKTPAAVKFISAEPLLEDIADDEVFSTYFYSGWTEPPYDDVLNWVIVGVEQLAGKRVGRNAEAYEQHARTVLRQCASAGVAAFHKQMPVHGRVSGDPAEWPLDLRVREFPKGVALDC